MLRLVAEKMRTRIGKNKDAVVEMYGSGFSARVARQARVAYRIDIPSAHLLAHFEAWRNRQIALGVNAGGEDNGVDFVRGQRRSLFSGAGCGDAAVNFSSRKQPSPDQQVTQSKEPLLVVTQAQIVFRGQDLASVA